MKKLSAIFILMFAISFISCGDTGVQYVGDSTDEEAIYNIMNVDRVSEFRIDLYDLSVPDTVLIVNNQYVPQYHWYDLEAFEPTYSLNRFYPQPGDSAGTVAYAIARKFQRFEGTFEIIAIDTSGGGNTPVRLSKNVNVLGWIEARLEKWGLNHNFRRGWLLKEISNVIFDSGISVVVNSSSNENVVMNAERMTLGQVLSFNPGEQVTVTVDNYQAGDLIRLTYFTAGGLSTMRAITEDSTTTDFQFNLPNNSEANHFFVDYIPSYVFSDTVTFSSAGIGVLYSTY